MQHVGINKSFHEAQPQSHRMDPPPQLNINSDLFSHTPKEPIIA